MSCISCALCDNAANEFCTVEIPVEGLGNLAVYFCEDHFKILTPRFIEFGSMRSATRRDDNSEEEKRAKVSLKSQFHFLII
jgi:hypothetical protein